MWDLNPRTHKPNFMRYNHLANSRSNLFMTIRFFLTGIVESNHGFRLGMRNYEVTFNLAT